jgi:hypothetical protein
VGIGCEVAQLRRLVQRDEPQIRAVRALLRSHGARLKVSVRPARGHHGNFDVIDVAVQLLELVIHQRPPRCSCRFRAALFGSLVLGFLATAHACGMMGLAARGASRRNAVLAAHTMRPG